MEATNINISEINTFCVPLKFKGRIAKKSSIQSFGSQNLDYDKYFYIEVIDSTSTIKCLAFNQDAIRLFDRFQENHVYVIENGSVREANRRFNFLPHKFEIFFNGKTLVTEDDQEFPLHSYLTPLSDIAVTSNSSPYIDTIGVLVKTGNVQYIQRRSTGEDLILRNIVLANDDDEISVTLWNDQATNFFAEVGDVIGIRNAKVNNFNGCKKISLSTSAQILINPLWYETDILKRWYSTRGQYETRNNLSQTVSTLGDSQLSAEVSQTKVSKNFLEKILVHIKDEQEDIKRRFDELESEEEKIKAEKHKLVFKKQRLEKERRSIVNELDDVLI